MLFMDVPVGKIFKCVPVAGFSEEAGKLISQTQFIKLESTHLYNAVNVSTWRTAWVNPDEKVVVLGSVGVNCWG